MKIRILSVIILSAILGNSALAQSFQIVGGDTVINSVDLDPTPAPGAYIYVKNISGGYRNLLVTREIISKASGHVTSFCFGTGCYGPNTNTSADIIGLAEEEIDSTFKGIVDGNGVQGSTIVRYCFQNEANPSDQSCIVVRHNFSTTSIRPEGPSERSSAVEASYDSYNKTIHVIVNGGKIDVMNMLGQQVPLSFRYDGGGMTADASTLKTGYYFLFGRNEKGPWSARVVVNKQ